MSTETTNPNGQAVRFGKAPGITAWGRPKIDKDFIPIQRRPWIGLGPFQWDLFFQSQDPSSRGIGVKDPRRQTMCAVCTDQDLSLMLAYIRGHLNTVLLLLYF